MTVQGARDDHGFGLVEVIIAMLLLAVVAIAILPALWQGIRFSSQQSATATATRHVYSLIEEARADPKCATLAAVTAADTITDGGGADIDVSGTYDAGSCAKGNAVDLTITATDASGAVVARVDAKVYIP